jgi:methylenetetrahydrofolate reductase (NADPH)
MASLEQTIAQLEPLEPDFVSVTYGAGGSTRGRTLEIARRIKDNTRIEAMAHLTCVGHSQGEIAEILGSLSDAGIENIMALRGDPPAGEERFVACEGGFSHGSELIDFIAGSEAQFCVGGAAYPEGHIETPNRHDDLGYLLEKQQRGAAFFVTQLFFENACFFHFLDRARRAGVKVPVIAGIMPIENAEQIRRFTQRCGATIPARLSNALDRCVSPEEVHQLGVDWAVDQCQELLAEGVAGLHFYTLNRSSSTREIITALRNQAGR